MTESRLVRALRGIVAAITAQTRCHVPVRYRVVSQTVDRYNLQAVSKAAGWPDILPCAVMAGAAGYKANLTPGSIVLVQFIEGDETQPMITHFEQPGQPGFVPVAIKIGADSGPAAAAARVGDQVTVFFPAGIPLTGTVSGNPFVGTFTTPVTGIGTIQTGSSKVGIGG